MGLGLAPATLGFPPALLLSAPAHTLQSALPPTARLRHFSASLSVDAGALRAHLQLQAVLQGDVPA